MSQDVIRDAKLGRGEHAGAAIRRNLRTVEKYIEQLEAENAALRLGNGVVPSIGATVSARTLDGEPIVGTLEYVYVAVSTSTGRLLHAVSPASVIRSEVA